LDAAVERAVRALIRNQKYIGKIITDDNSNNEGLICIEEQLPKTASSIAQYIVQLPAYTEMHCRVIFRQIVEIIKLCHDNGLAHRNLLFTSLLVDSRVRITIVKFMTMELLCPINFLRECMLIV
jgi:serine/threonine protein kinase